MDELKDKSFNVFDMFSRQTALVTAGDIKNFNGCTIGWGSVGNIWAVGGKTCPIINIYVYPTRLTCDYLKANEFFTVSFFPAKYRGALMYMGSHSGRDGDKVKAARLTPVTLENSVAYEEANLTFLCRKLYQHEFIKEDLAEEIRDYYKSAPRTFPPDENGNWQTHYMFVGEIIKVCDRR